MKHILILFIFLIPILGYSQIGTIGNKKIPTKILGKTIIDSALILPRDTISLSSIERGIAYLNKIYIFNGIKWKPLDSAGSANIVLKNGGPITSLPDINFNPNSTDIVNWIDTVFYRSRPPTATLSGGIVLEYRSPQTMTQTLNFTGGRNIGTLPIQSIIINGVSKTFAQPSEGSYYSGVHNVSFPANTDIIYTNIVTTTDGKTASATTTFYNRAKRYFGWVSDTTGIGTVSYNDAIIRGLGNELSTSKSKGGSGAAQWDTGNPTGTQFYVYAYYTPFGDLTQWDMNGFPSIDAMNKATRSFTNTLGFVGTWTIYWSKNGQTLSSTIVAN